MSELSKNDIVDYMNLVHEITSLMDELNSLKDPQITYSKNIFLPITNI